MPKIIITNLTLGGETFPTPPGLSELLEQAWTKPQENNPVEEFASQFNRIVFRNSEGRLVSRFEKR